MIKTVNYGEGRAPLAHFRWRVKSEITPERSTAEVVEPANGTAVESDMKQVQQAGTDLRDKLDENTQVEDSLIRDVYRLKTKTKARNETETN